MAGLVLLPALSFVFLVGIIFSKLNKCSWLENLRIAIVNGFVIYALYIAAITELLSSVRLIRFDAILISWLLTLFALCYYAWRINLFSSFLNLWPNLKRFVQSEPLIWLMLLLLAGSLVIALVYPVNNFDSLTYHMARVGHWEQNQSISHYKTHIIRQIEFPPLAEWIILHLQILCGGDRFANSVQLIFFAGCICCVSLIAKSLGANRRQQLLSSVAACFIPMAILESNTTQNDIVVSFFILAFAYYTLRFAREAKFVGYPLSIVGTDSRVTIVDSRLGNLDSPVSIAILSGISLGLAWLTKGSAYIFTSVFCVWYIVLAIKMVKTRHFLRRMALFAMIPAIAILINSGHYYRNIFFCGSPVGKEGRGTANEAYELKPLVLVGVKNLLNHIPMRRPTKEKIVITIASKLGVDPEDNRYNLATMESAIDGRSFHEDYAQNFYHTLLISLCILIFFFRKRSYQPLGSSYFLFVLSLITLAFLFSVLLKWQPWSSRLMTPLFLLFSVFMGIEIGTWRKLFSILAVGAMIIYGFVALCHSYRHPVFPIKQSIFSRHLDYSYFSFGNDLPRLKEYLDSKPHKKIGVYIGPDSWDYMYYKLLRGEGNQKRLLRHIYVNNESAMYIENFVPDAILSLEVSVDKYEFAGREYYRTCTTKDGVLFEPR